MSAAELQKKIVRYLSEGGPPSKVEITNYFNRYENNKQVNMRVYVIY